MKQRKRATKEHSKRTVAKKYGYQPYSDNPADVLGHAEPVQKHSKRTPRAMKIAKNRFGLLNDKIRTVHSAPYWAGPTTMQLAAAEIIEMITENVIEPATTEHAAQILFAPTKDHALCFFVGN